MEEMVEIGQASEAQPREQHPVPAKPKASRPKGSSKRSSQQRRVDIGELNRMMRMTVAVDQTSVEDLADRVARDGMAFVTAGDEVAFVVQSPEAYGKA